MGFIWFWLVAVMIVGYVVLDGFAGEGVGVAGIDQQGAGLAALDPCATPIHRRRGAFRFGEHPRDSRSFVEQRQHDVGAPFVAHAGGAGGETHAVDRRNFGGGFGSERRNNGGFGHLEKFLEDSCATCLHGRGRTQGNRRIG